MTSTVAIVWPCSLRVDEYEAAGRDLVVARPDCPSCARPMIFWSWYYRTVRHGDDRRILVRRSKCVPCGASHGLLPAFCLLNRLYSVEVIGPAVAAIVNGRLAREVAEDRDIPYTTARDWRRRHRDRAAVLAAGFVALAVGLGAVAPALAGAPERASTEALGLCVGHCPGPLRRGGGGALAVLEPGERRGGAVHHHGPAVDLGRREAFDPPSAMTAMAPTTGGPTCPPIPPKRSPCSATRSSPRRLTPRSARPSAA